MEKHNVLFISGTGQINPVAYKMRREGTDAKVYIHDQGFNQCHEGLLPEKVTLATLKTAIDEADTVVFDNPRVSGYDNKAIKMATIFGLESDQHLFSALADTIREKKTVIGISRAGEELENDFSKGIELATQAGFLVPPGTIQKTLRDAILHLKDNSNKLWTARIDELPELDNYVEKFEGELAERLFNVYQDRLDETLSVMLQEKIGGAEVSAEVYISKSGTIVWPHFIYEDRRFLNGSMGQLTACQSTTVIPIDNATATDLMQHDLALKLYKAAQILAEQGHTGPLKVNCIVKNGGIYFLNWETTFSYDSFFPFLSLFDTPLTDFFCNDFAGNIGREYAASARITIPPYPNRTKDGNDAKDIPILNDYDAIRDNFWGIDIYLWGGRLRCSGTDGLLGVVTGTGDGLGATWGRVYREIDKLKICTQPQYRTDGYKQAERKMKLYLDEKNAKV